MHKSLERLAAAPSSQGVPSLRHPVSGDTCMTDAAKEAALAAFAAEVARAPEPVAQEERASVARARAALAAEQAHPGHDALGLGVGFTFDEVRDCLRSLKNHKAAGNDGIPAELLKYSGGTGKTSGWTAARAERTKRTRFRKDFLIMLHSGLCRSRLRRAGTWARRR